MKDIYAWIDAHENEILEEFFELLRVPGISALHEHLDEAAECTLNIVRRSGLPARLLPVRGGPPIVYSDIDEGARRTLLCYAHYDVQPVSPLEEWMSPPFEPQIRDGVIYARGATDNKAGIMVFVKAAQAFRAVRGRAPVNLKFVFEGEEEMGSPHFLDWVRDHTGLLQCDGSVCMDGPADHSTKRPPVQLGCKAILYVELHLKMNEKDIWSGYAGWVPSPVWRMIKLLNTMIDVNTGRILVDGWYDDWDPISAEDEQLLDRLYEQFNETEAMRELGITEWAWGEDARGALRRRHYGPTMNVCGISAGYAGPGGKTIIPHEIRVKLDFRCPPYLEPAVQLEKLKTHLKTHGYGDVELTVHTARANPYKISPREPIAQAVIRAADRVFGGMPTVYGVSIQGLIRVYVPHPAVMTGFADPDCRLHAPNENMPVDRFFKGVKYAATIMEEFAKEAPRQ